MSYVRVIAGLGNPGQQYEKTRHNLGARLLDEFYNSCLAQKRANAWKEQGQIRQAQVSLFDSEVLLLRSLKYMNVSGAGLAETLRYYKIEPKLLLVLYDDLDLPLGNLRFRAEGGDGGHNGVASLIENLGSSEFMRLRLGIGRPAPELAGKVEISDWVLGRFNAEEEVVVSQVLKRGVLAIEELARLGLKTAQNKFN